MLLTMKFRFGLLRIGFEMTLISELYSKSMCLKSQTSSGVPNSIYMWNQNKKYIFENNLNKKYLKIKKSQELGVNRSLTAKMNCWFQFKLSKKQDLNLGVILKIKMTI